MKQIPLTKGKFAIVNDGDYEFLSNWKWSASFNGSLWYAQRSEGPRLLRKTVQMHRFIMSAPRGMEVDHINGDTLDNRRENMRLCSRLQNGRNRKRPKNNTSGFKGVWWNKTCNKWEAEIRVNNKRIYLGHYSDPEEAARAYDEAAVEHFGDFAKINFPE